MILKEEIRIFFTAVMFYTRIPCPKWVDHSPEYINKSVRYFPLIGWIIGSVSFFFLFLGLFIDPYLGALLYLASSVWMTGAFHEDGFADMCDGFGGGWTKEQILKIMKDSRVGTYAVVGLIILLLTKLQLITNLIQFKLDYLTIFLTCLSGHSLSRWAAATVIFTSEYVREDAHSKAKPVAKSFTWSNVILSTIFGLIPLASLILLTQQWFMMLVVVAAYLVKVYLNSLFKKKLGGYTGDCLGATQQLTEVAIYLAILMVWKFT